MTRAHIDVTWDPDGRRRRVRRRAAKMALVLVSLLSTLSWAEKPVVRPGVTIAATVEAKDALPASTEVRSPARPVPAPSLAPTVTSMSFGAVAIGSTLARRLTFRNQGTASFAASAVVFEGQRTAPFEIDRGDCDRVAPGATCAAYAVFRPAAVGRKDASIRLLDVSGALSGPVSLTGRGTRLPRPPR